MNLRLYRADCDYCARLRMIDGRVSDVSEGKEPRPFLGVVFVVSDINYCAPLSSPKPKHMTMKNNIDFLKIGGGQWGVINFNNMIPIHFKDLSLVDTTIRVGDDRLQTAYKNLLTNQIYWCNSNKEIIVKKARNLYEKHRLGRLYPNVFARCCDYELLEKEYRRYCLERRLSAEAL